MFPHSRSIMKAAQLEEERRLFYVGMTRAEQKLYLTSARFRRYFGNMDQQVSEPSRFLAGDSRGTDRRRRRATAQAGAELRRLDLQLGRCRDERLSVPRRSASPPRQTCRLSKKSAGKWTMGTRVKHPKYGNGTILRTEGDGDDMKLTISFMSHGLKKMIAKYAELEAPVFLIRSLTRVNSPVVYEFRSSMDTAREIERFCHLIYEKQFVAAQDGNISVRLPDGNDHVHADPLQQRVSPRPKT